MDNNPIVTLRNNLIYVRENIYDILAEVITENATLIEDLNIKQLQEGRRSDGELLPNYSPRSVAQFGKKPGPMTLFDTGAFYRGIVAGVFEDKFELIGEDPKTEMLQMLYSKYILGLDVDSVDYLINEILRPELIKKLQLLLTQ